MVFKRTWFVMLSMLVLGVVLSACSGGDLAPELTAIPTLPPGQEPELIAALQQAGAAPTAPPAIEDMDPAQLIALGQEVFVARCVACHGAVAGVGPALTGMAERAATRIAGVPAEEYLYRSIVEPGAYVVEGYANLMPANYAQELSEAELQGLVAYILAEGGAAEAPAPTAEPTAEPTAAPTVAPTAEPTPEPAAEEPAAVAGDPARGEALFAQACAACHGAQPGAGPALVGMGERAATRVEGLSAEEYLHQSIVEPGAYVVEGFANIMPGMYGTQYDESQLQDLIAYILTQ